MVKKWGMLLTLMGQNRGMVVAPDNRFDLHFQKVFIGVKIQLSGQAPDAADFSGPG